MYLYDRLKNVHMYLFMHIVGLDNITKIKKVDMNFLHKLPKNLITFNVSETLIGQKANKKTVRYIKKEKDA